LSPPLPSSLAPIKHGNPGSPGKMAIKMERKREFSSFQLLMLCHMSAAVCYVSVAFWVVRSICPAVHTELLKAETYLLNPYISQGVLGLREV